MGRDMNDRVIDGKMKNGCPYNWAIQRKRGMNGYAWRPERR